MKSNDECKDKKYHELKLVIDSIPSLVCYFDHNRRYKMINSSYERWFGLKSENIIGKHLSEIVGEEAYNQTAPNIDLAFEGQTTIFELETPYLYGKPRYVEVTLTPDLNPETGRVDGVVGLVNDLTTRKELENAERLARQRAELMLETAATLNKKLSVSEVTQEILKQVGKIFNPEGIVFLLKDSKENNLNLMGAWGRNALGDKKTLSFERSGPLAAAILQVKSLFFSNLQEAIKHYPMLSEYVDLPKGAIAVLPLVVDQKPFGVIGIGFNEQRVWENNEQIYLRTLIKQCALAYEKARLIETERAVNEHFQNIFDNAPISIIVTEGPNHKISYINKKAKETYALSDEHTQKFMADLDYASPNKYFLDLMDHVVKTGESVSRKSKPIVKNDGSVIYVNFNIQSSSKVISHNKDGAILFSFDVTESIKIREAMNSQRLWLENILDSLPIPLVLLESESKKVFFANKEAKEEFSDFLISNEPHADESYVLSADGRVLEKKDWPFFDAKETDRITGEEIGVYTSKKGLNQYLWGSIVIKEHYGYPEISVLVFKNITDIKQKEIELRHAKDMAESASQSKSNFLANMSHEIRTPLNAIIGFSDMIKDENLPLEERNSYIDIICKNGRQLSTLINDILDFSKIEAGHMNVELLPVDISNVIQGIQDLFLYDIKKKGLELKIEMDDSVPERICSDPLRVSQVLINLVGNAIKFTDRGFIELKVEFDSDHSLNFYIKDTGIGLSEYQKKNLFQPFTQADASMTRKYGGTGLGLALSLKLAQMMGGNITLVHSTEKLGATFLFSIPANLGLLQKSIKSENIKLKKNKDLENKKFEGQKILVAEDSKDNQRLLNYYLSTENLKIDFADNGLEALEKALSNDYEAILMDIQMPLMDGYTATKKLRARGYKKAIIALTAHAMVDDQVRSLNEGCNAHVTKPIERKELLSVLQNFLY